MTPSGIEPATFRLVAQYLNRLRRRLPVRLIVVTSYLVAGMSNKLLYPEDEGTKIFRNFEEILAQINNFSNQKT
jgi:hypothetical protein